VAGRSTAFPDDFFVLLLTAAIVVSLQVIGVLLVEAMMGAPAAAARNVARSAGSHLALSAAFSVTLTISTVRALLVPGSSK
jgi:zinc transport system permease protein